MPCGEFGQFKLFLDYFFPVAFAILIALQTHRTICKLWSEGSYVYAVCVSVQSRNHRTCQIPFWLIDINFLLLLRNRFVRLWTFEMGAECIRIFCFCFCNEWEIVSLIALEMKINSLMRFPSVICLSNDSTFMLNKSFYTMEFKILIIYDGRQKNRNGDNNLAIII